MIYLLSQTDWKATQSVMYHVEQEHAFVKYFCYCEENPRASALWKAFCTWRLKWELEHHRTAVNPSSLQSINLFPCWKLDVCVVDFCSTYFFTLVRQWHGDNLKLANCCIPGDLQKSIALANAGRWLWILYSVVFSSYLVCLSYSYLSINLPKTKSLPPFHISSSYVSCFG